ncbi:hypothetical protein B0F90DRAFT_582233 [Multifurca ochricompacta]|uniref:Uncharacterized protein n=1 Tax=Multifurca ochricompacta TaxID=376703 RepID=A0AAD4LV21_9AGAM|nr:hypothetical protein B0F90DRAFT_582233 [Multifurca ochricompacta]
MANRSPSPPLRARKSSILDGSCALCDPANSGTDSCIHKPEVEMVDADPLPLRESTQLLYLTEPQEDALLFLPSSTPAPHQRNLPPPPTPTTPDVLEVILNKLTDRIAVLEAKVCNPASRSADLQVSSARLVARMPDPAPPPPPPTRGPLTAPAAPAQPALAISVVTSQNHGAAAQGSDICAGRDQGPGPHHAR